MTEPRRSIEVVPYDREWPRHFERYAEEMRAACGDLLVTLEHIGSTAVPGLEAKPIIDMMPGVASHDDARRCVPLLEGLGLRYLGEYGIAGRYYFNDGLPRRRHVHLFVVGEGQWRGHLDLRDYLRAHVEERAAYGRLKRELAARYRDDPAGYTDAKAGFVEGVLARARAWRAAAPNRRVP